MVEQVNLNEVGVLTQGGKHYGGTGEGAFQSAKLHQTNMESMLPGFRGMGGSMAQGVAGMASMTTAQLAKHFVDQAVRSVQSERDGITGDESSHTDQLPAQASTEQIQQASVPAINV